MGRRPASDREHSRQEKDRAQKRRRRDLLQDAEASKSNTTFLETTPEKVVAGGKPVIAANGASNVSRRSRATRLPEDAKTVNGVHAAQAVTNVVEKPTTEMRSRTTQIAAATVATSPARVAATAPALSSSLAEVAAAAIISGSTAELTPASTPAGSDLAEVTATPPVASTSIPVVSAAQPFDLSNLRTIVINLERRPDRWQGCTDRLRLHCPGLPFERFVASDGRQDVIAEHEVALSWHTGKNVVYQRKRSVRKGWDDLSSYVERSLSLSPGERGCRYLTTTGFRMTSVAAFVLYLHLALLFVRAIKIDYAHPKRYLIASSPLSTAIGYASLPRGGGLRSNTEMKTLINSSLVEPMGVAVDQLRQRLFVADPGGQQILAYSLHISSDPEYLGVTGPEVWATGTSARWVTVDSEGSIYFSDEAANKLLTISFEQASRGNHTPQVLYDGSSLVSLSAPGGVAVDQFWLYFVNKQSGTTVGSIVKAPKAAPPMDWAAAHATELNNIVQPLATNTDKSYGVCLAMQNLFYTQPSNQIYGVLASGNGAGSFATVSDRLTMPRGCAFDKDGTVYVADRGANAIYSFAGNQQTLTYALVQKTADFEDAFDVAVFSGAHRRCGRLLVVTLISSAWLILHWFGV